MVNQKLIDNFPPKDESELFDNLQFIKKVPFAKDYWQVFKKLYKLTETAILENTEHEQIERLINMIGNLIYRIDQENIKAIKSPFPTHATLRYMKRRARRFLRKLATINNELYVKVAKKILLANIEKNNIDFDNQWITADIILGSSRRAFQKGHGQGSYVFHNQNYHLHQKEDKFPEIWDNELNLLRELLDKNLPYEIYEFAVKVLLRNDIKIKDISEERLIQFFDSPSIHLKLLATDLAYQTFTFQGLKPEIYAGLWLYSNDEKKKRVLDIVSKRPKLPKEWQKSFAKHLAKYTFNELRQGNNKNRVIASLEFLQKKHKETLTKTNVLPFANVLFNSKSEVLQNLAVLGSKSAKYENILAWIQALGNERNPQRDNLYKKIQPNLSKLFKKRKIYGDTIEAYVFQKSYYACDFGWEMSQPVRHYNLYYIWNTITNYQSYRRAKQVYFYNAITSPNGTEAFIKYYNNNSYYLNYINNDNIAYIFQHATPKIADFVINRFSKDFKDEPLYNLRKIAFFPEKIRSKLFENALKRLKNKELFNYYWHVNTAFYQIQENEWVKEAVFRLIEVAKIELNSAENIINQALNRGKTTEDIFNFLDKLEDDKKRNLFIFALSGNTSHLLTYSDVIPQKMLSKAISMLTLENLLFLTTSADDKSWGKLQKNIYQELLNKVEEKGFWKNILQLVINSETNTLSTRLLEDKQFFALFENQKDVGVLDITDPTFEEVLLAWAKNNTKLFEMGSANLFKICIHKLPKLRQLALEYADSQGLTLIFALQLFESDLPDAINLAKKYFENLEANSLDERDAVLALIDSPNKNVRTFGLSFIGKRKENFENLPRVLEFLSEHSDSVVLDFVAEEITKKQINADFVKRFDKEVLRMKNRSRTAKEKVKNRVEDSLDIDVQTLLELSQSKVKKDAEWAILQLTKKVLAGEEVKGFVLE